MLHLHLHLRLQYRDQNSNLCMWTYYQLFAHNHNAPCVYIPYKSCIDRMSWVGQHKCSKIPQRIETISLSTSFFVRMIWILFMLCVFASFHSIERCLNEVLYENRSVRIAPPKKCPNSPTPPTLTRNSTKKNLAFISENPRGPSARHDIMLRLLVSPSIYTQNYSEMTKNSEKIFFYFRPKIREFFFAW